MKIFLCTLYVDDQEKALAFYTQKLGFVKKTDVSNNGYRWLTVASPEEPNGPELLLEPAADPAAKAWQQAMLVGGRPAAMFQVANLNEAFTRLSGMGVAFKLPPQDLGPMKIAQFTDTCGNMIQLNQPVMS